MGKVMRFQSGSLAIYTDATPSNPSTAPLTNPTGNLGVLAFHSDLYYPRIVSTHSGSTTLPANSALTIASGDLVTIAHGLGAAPLAFGTITVTVSGVDRTYHLNGTVIVPDTDPNNTIGVQYPFLTLAEWNDFLAQERERTSAPTYLTLAADDTNVYLQYYQFMGRGARRYYDGTNFIVPTTTYAQSATYDIYILDLLRTQTTAPDGDPTKPQLTLSPSRITMGREKFDTNLQYIRSATSSDDVMVTGETIQLSGAPVNANASTTAPSYFGTMQLNTDNNGNQHYVYREASTGSYPSPTETPIQFP